MPRLRLGLSLFALGLPLACKHVPREVSNAKAIQAFEGRRLVGEANFEINKLTPLSLVIDSHSQAPVTDARLFVRELHIKLLPDESTGTPCPLKIASIKALGDRGEQEFSQQKVEGDTYVFARSQQRIFTQFYELRLSFSGDTQDACRCRIAVSGDGQWAAPLDMGYQQNVAEAPRDAAIRAYGSSYEHRLNHYLWHTTRSIWPKLETRRDQLKDKPESAAALAEVESAMNDYRRLGWEPPRPLRGTAPEIAASGAGEDFIFMHHKMLGRVQEHLSLKGFSMIPPFAKIPKPDDPSYPLGLQDVARPASGNKSDAYYYANIRTWEAAYQQDTVDIEALAEAMVKAYAEEMNPPQTKTIEEARTFVTNLLQGGSLPFKGVKGLSLSAYGHLLEMTIHNALHMRFAYGNLGRASDADPMDRAAWEKGWADVYDGTSYDWLGDTYSSHVHPWFYRIHGWVEARLQTWLDANGYKSVGSKEECSKLVQPCYVWLSDVRYNDLARAAPWEGSMGDTPAPDSNPTQNVMSLHAHHSVPGFKPATIESTRGLRAQSSLMSGPEMDPIPMP